MNTLSQRLRTNVTPGGTIVLLGMPGAGKTTQAKILAERFGLLHLETGALVRKATEEDSERGALCRRMLAQNKLVPDNVMLELFEEALRGRTEGMLLDGFPRTRSQAERLMHIIPTITRAVMLELPVTVAWERVLRRGRDEYDNADAIYERTMDFNRHIGPIMNFYLERRLLSYVPRADLTIDEVTDQVVEAIASRSQPILYGRRRNEEPPAA